MSAGSDTGDPLKKQQEGRKESLLTKSTCELFPPQTCQLLAYHPKKSKENCAQTHTQDDLISWALRMGLGKPPEMQWVFPGSTEQGGTLLCHRERVSSCPHSWFSMITPAPLPHQQTQ